MQFGKSLIVGFLAFFGGLTQTQAAPPPEVISETAIVRPCSSASNDLPENHFCLVRGPVLDAAFITEKDQLPFVVLDLKKSLTLTKIKIANAKDKKAAAGNAGLFIEISDDGKKWKNVFQAKDSAPGKEWNAGFGNAGKAARFVRIGLKQGNPRSFSLSRVTIWGNA